MPRLPAVIMSPYSVFSRMLRLTEANSTLTLPQSHSSSSARSMGRPEPVPWPISAMRLRRVDGVVGLDHHPGVDLVGVGRVIGPIARLQFRHRGAGGARNEQAQRQAAGQRGAGDDELAAGETLDVLGHGCYSRFLAGGAVDGAADAHIGAAAADIACHGRVDVGSVGLGRSLQERGRRHDLAGLAIAALRHVLGDPGLLHRVGCRPPKALRWW